jgi:5'-nucleotidase
LKRPTIFVTNDDGISAPGIQALIEAAQTFGNVLVIAPDGSRSGMSHAITIKDPLRIYKICDEPGLIKYVSNGTPVDCIKLGLNQIFKTKPDLILSGINHGSNASVSILYSGTMGAVVEGCIYNIDSIGFSITNHEKNADFTASKIYAHKIIDYVLKNGLTKGTCLNVNIPIGKPDEIKGIKICRQNKGFWKEEFDKRSDPNNQDYYWLTGSFENTEPESTDTDEFALKNKYVSVVPALIDMTAYCEIANLKAMSFDKSHKI